VATTARFIRPDFAGKRLTTREVLDEEEAMIKIAEAGEGAYPEFGNGGEWQYTTPLVANSEEQKRPIEAKVGKISNLRTAK
jgi:hypothetical protein